MYFITICTKNRECLLSSVVFKEKTNEAQISLLYEGAVADKYIQSINKVYKNICISYYIIMPNHIHLWNIRRKRAVEDADPYKCYNSINGFYI